MKLFFSIPRQLAISALISVSCLASASAWSKFQAPPEVPELPEEVERLVQAAERQRYNAITHGDTDTLKIMLGKNYYHVDSNGRLRSKTEFLQAVERGDFMNAKIAMNKAEMVLDGQVVIVRGVSSVGAHTTGTAKRLTFRYIRMWQCVSGRYVNVMHQTTMVHAPLELKNLGMF